MLVPLSENASVPMLGLPVAARFASVALSEWAQPCPTAPLLPHGQAVPVPSPKQNGVAGERPVHELEAVDRADQDA